MVKLRMALTVRVTDQQDIIRLKKNGHKEKIFVPIEKPNKL